MKHDDDDRTLLASAYLDNEATPDERARVDADPEALAEVAALGDVRTVLDASIEPVSLAAREAHLAVALDVFERMSDGERRGENSPNTDVDAAAGAALTTPLSSSDTGRHRRPRNSNSSWLLGAAAALLVLVGVGAVLRGGLGGGTDDSGNAAVQSSASDAAEDAATEAELVEEAEADEVLDRATNEPEPPQGGIDGDDAFSEGAELNATTGAAPEADASPGLFDDDAMEEADDEAPVDGAEQPSPPPDLDLVELLDTDDLGAFATPAASAQAPDGAPEFDDDFRPPFDSCERVFDVQRIAGPALYQGTEVIVGIDLVNDIVYAYTSDDCQLVASTGLPDDVVTTTQP